MAIDLLAVNLMEGLRPGVRWVLVDTMVVSVSLKVVRGRECDGLNTKTRVNKKSYG